MKIKTSELEGEALDWAVAHATGRKPMFVGDSPEDMVVIAQFIPGVTPEGSTANVAFEPSTDWSQGGPLIDRYKIGVLFLENMYDAEDGWEAGFSGIQIGSGYKGETALIAAMRAIVAAEIGDEVEVPDELAQAS